MSSQDLIVALKNEIKDLQSINKDLENKLRSRRYRFIDKVVDSSYSIIRRNNRKKKNQQKLEYSQCYTHNNKHFDQTERKATTVYNNFEKKRIDIINVSFYDWDGNNVFKGGAERYVFDLACLLKKLGYKPRILQGANKNFEKNFRGISVVGIKMEHQDMRSISLVFNKACLGARAIIASPLELACELTNGVPIISINHGINFDHPSNQNKNIVGNLYPDHIDGLLLSDCCVCVDTNFINWMRTRDYELSKKMKYIPNYYDKKLFSNIKRQDHKRLSFVYPRRIYPARGHEITLRVFRKILEKYPKTVELHMIGEIDNELAKKDIDNMLHDFPNNVFHSSYTMEKMYKAYEKADVVLIPTLYSEGTSLSCIEAMASGVAIISTNIGGLPNLIIDEFNGLLISPTDDDLESAVEKLINDPELRKKLAINGKQVAESAFTKKNWDEKWEKILQNELSKK